MKTRLFLIICFCLSVQFTQSQKTLVREYPFGEPGATSRGVFGEDDRREAKDAEGFEDFVRATAVMIPKTSMAGNRIYGESLRTLLSNRFAIDTFSTDVKFLDQPTAAGCTGFLIAPDILVTAGHCIQTLEDAEQYVWLFDYTQNLNFNGEYLEVDPKNIFEVAEVLSAELDEYSESDYSVLRLKRKSDRRPYRFRTSGTISDGENIYTVGAPTGLPLKLAENAVVVENTPEYWFKSDIDVFPGNSGGPVFDENGWIEGILVRGAVQLSSGEYSADFIHDTVCNCIRTVNFKEVGETAGSQSHKITQIPPELMFRSIYENLDYGIRNFSEQRLEDWLEYSWMLDHHYTRTRKLLEEVALETGNYKALDRILDFTQSGYSDEYTRSLLDKAISLKDQELLKLLLENELYADAGESSNYTLLQEAVRGNDLGVARLLVEHGANHKATDVQQNNLLHYAAATGDLAMLKFLVSLGIDAGLKNSDGKYPEKIAKSNDFKTASKYLKNARKGKL